MQLGFFLNLLLFHKNVERKMCDRNDYQCLLLNLECLDIDRMQKTFRLMSA